MRYERSSQVTPAPRRRARPARIAVVCAVAASGATGLGLVLESSGATGAISVHAPTARVLEAVVAETLVLEDDLGAPPPPGTTNASWALRSAPVAGDFATSSLRLTGPLHRWVSSRGALQLLDGSTAATLLRSQRADISAVATGALRAELQRELASIVQGEQRSGGGLSGPGGVAVVQWYSVSVDGRRASVDGALYDFDERLALSGAAGRARVSASVQSGEIEAVASLARVGSAWRVATLAVKPFQQPT